MNYPSRALKIPTGVSPTDGVSDTATLINKESQELDPI